jgi:hypothetical protein
LLLLVTALVTLRFVSRTQRLAIAIPRPQPAYLDINFQRIETVFNVHKTSFFILLETVHARILRVMQMHLVARMKLMHPVAIWDFNYGERRRVALLA